jgi:phosphoglycolate phosphatase
MKLETIIFDMDGTLLDSLDGLRHSTNAALSRYGYPERTMEDIRAFVGNGVGKLVERSLPGGLQNPDYEKCLAAFKEDYKTAMFTGTRPYPGVVLLLEALRAEGYGLAVVSNKLDGAVKALSQRFFGGLLPVAIGEVAGAARKPAPDSVFAALKELGAQPETAAYVGDSEVDLQTARNSGLPCLSVDWGTRSTEFLLQNGATSISHTAEEVLHTIRGYSIP